LKLTFSRLLIYGGESRNKWAGDLKLFDTDSNTWEDVQTAGDAPVLSEHGTATLEGLVYIFGGIYKDGKYSNDLYSFDPSTKVWKKHKCNGSPPNPRAGHSLCSYHKFLIVFGGYEFKDVFSQDLYDDTHILDTGLRYFKKIFFLIFFLFQETFTWHVVSSKGPSPRKYHVSAVLGGYMFVFGGKAADEHFLNDLWVLNIELKSIFFKTVFFLFVYVNSLEWDQQWKHFGYIPTPRASASVSVMDDYLVILGGRSKGEVFSDIFLYNAKKNLWSQAQIPMKMPSRFSHKIIIVRDHLYVFGGRVENIETGTNDYNSDLIKLLHLSLIIGFFFFCANCYLEKYIREEKFEEMEHSDVKGDLLHISSPALRKKIRSATSKFKEFNLSPKDNLISKPCMYGRSSCRFLTSLDNFVPKVRVDRELNWVGNSAELFELKEKLGQG